MCCIICDFVLKTESLQRRAYVHQVVSKIGRTIESYVFIYLFGEETAELRTCDCFSDFKSEMISDQDTVCLGQFIASGGMNCESQFLHRCFVAPVGRCAMKTYLKMAHSNWVLWYDNNAA